MLILCCHCLSFFAPRDGLGFGAPGPLVLPAILRACRNQTKIWLRQGNTPKSLFQLYVGLTEDPAMAARIKEKDVRQQALTSARAQFELLLQQQPAGAVPDPPVSGLQLLAEAAVTLS